VKSTTFTALMSEEKPTCTKPNELGKICNEEGADQQINCLGACRNCGFSVFNAQVVKNNYYGNGCKCSEPAANDGDSGN
jgi:hypothetical protein